MPYSSSAEVIEYTGIKPEDLYLKDDPDGTPDGETAQQKLEALIGRWLLQAKSFIDSNRNRDYEQEVQAGKRSEVPPGIHNVAMRIVANMIAQAAMRRDTTVVKVDDYSIQITDDKIFTSAIQQDLANFPAKLRLGISRVRGYNQFVEETEEEPQDV